MLVVEEHRSSGGLYDAVLHKFAELGAFPNAIDGLGTPLKNTPVVGNQKFLREKHGLGSNNILGKIQELLKRRHLTLYKPARFVLTKDLHLCCKKLMRKNLAWFSLVREV